MEIIYSFIGCFFALVIYDLVKLITNKKKKQTSIQSNKREIPKNIGRFADPLGEYEYYKGDNNLYKSYVPKKIQRRGE